jgi:hypothetical protein
VDFCNLPNPGPGVDSSSNRNEYQELSSGVKSGRLITLPASVSRLSRKYGNLNVSQPYGSPRSVIGAALPLPTKIGYPCRLDSVSLTIQLSVGLYKLTNPTFFPSLQKIIVFLNIGLCSPSSLAISDTTSPILFSYI